MTNIAALTPEIERLLHSLNQELLKEYHSIRVANWWLEQMIHDHGDDLAQDTFDLLTSISDTVDDAEYLAQRLDNTRLMLSQLAYQTHLLAQNTKKVS